MGADQTILFHSTIFGPVHSRRLGVSLGVNLTPRDGKICTFDCLYCEAGYNSQGPGKAGLPSREETARLLSEKLTEMRSRGEKPDVITFSGNGEPTIHPDFEGIIDDTLRLRDLYCPEAKVSVLTNSTMLERPDVVRALRRVDNNILKLDSAIEETMRLINRPGSPGFSVKRVTEQLKQFRATGIIQTMMLRGEHAGRKIDNTTSEEIAALAEAYTAIGPREIMLYSLDRTTPEERLEKIPAEELRRIGAEIERLTGIEVKVN